MSYERQAVEHIEVLVDSAHDDAFGELLTFVEGMPNMQDDDNRRALDNLLENYYMARRSEEVFRAMKAAYHAEEAE